MVAVRFAQIILLVMLTASTAFSDDFPYTGYFTYQSEKPEIALMQAKCAHMFFKQNADGSGVNYILDDEAYAKTGEVRYNIFAANWCHHDAKLRTNNCNQEIYDESGASKSESFDVLQIGTKDSFSNVFFVTELEQKIFVDAKDKTLPSWKFPTASVVYSQRCIGFNDQTLQSHLTKSHSVLNQQDLATIMNRTVNTDRFSQILDIMQKIGKEAMNATLPGQ